MYILYWICFSVGTKSRRDSVADPALQIGGGGGGVGGHLDPKIRGGGGLRNFGGASVWSKNKGGGGPPLDPPLGLNYILCSLLRF